MLTPALRDRDTREHKRKHSEEGFNFTKERSMDQN